MLIYWHKKDYRLLDNPALQKSLELCHLKQIEFLPIMGIESDLVQNSESNYEFGNFWKFGVSSAIIPLYKNYNHFGITAGLFYEPIISYLRGLNLKQRIKYLVSHQEHGTGLTYQRDKEVAEFCKECSIKWIQIPPSGVVRNLESRDISDALVKKYINGATLKIPDFGENLQRNINSNFWSEITKDNNNIKIQLENIIWELSSEFELQPTSEKHALETLNSFVTYRAEGYRGGISSPNSAFVSGSRLSQYLAFGSLSLRFVYKNYWSQINSTSNTKIKAGILGSMKRLFWREHFVQRIETSSDMTDVAINVDYDSVDYSNNKELFEAYKLGQTGEPIIDACMRRLNKTGFINFRMRAMIISYAVFGLDLNWREVGRHLASVFLDYEPGIHWSQIQMQSGVTGINTIRVYSPYKQLIDQDPDCVFVKTWIPELSDIECVDILNYTKTNLFELTSGKYPSPIVDFKSASKLNKHKTFAVRNTSSKANSKATFQKHGSRKKTTKKPTKKPNLRSDHNPKTTISNLDQFSGSEPIL